MNGCLLASSVAGVFLVLIGLLPWALVDCSPTGECPTTPGNLFFATGILVLGLSLLLARIRPRPNDDER